MFRAAAPPMLVAASAFDLLLGWFRLSFNFWVDARFYLGWSLGLLLAPSQSAAEERSD
jgi:hypothetical protein